MIRKTTISQIGSCGWSSPPRAIFPTPRGVYTRDTPMGTHLPDRDAVIAGDAIVTLDPYTAKRGPRIVAGAATVDSTRNLSSLDALARTGARTVLVGHGAPWKAGAEAAVDLAREVGAR